MTPRALLTAIGATALAFAIAIAIAAERTTGVETDSACTAVSTVETSSETLLDMTGATSERLNAWNDPCVIAV
jgi:hypothetical protein